MKRNHKEGVREFDITKCVEIKVAEIRLIEDGEDGDRCRIVWSSNNSLIMKNSAEMIDFPPTNGQY